MSSVSATGSSRPRLRSGGCLPGLVGCERWQSRAGEEAAGRAGSARNLQTSFRFCGRGATISTHRALATRGGSTGPDTRPLSLSRSASGCEWVSPAELSGTRTGGPDFTDVHAGHWRGISLAGTRAVSGAHDRVALPSQQLQNMLRQGLRKRNFKLPSGYLYFLKKLQ